MPAPSFLLVGAARSGTTALVRAIRRHPRAFVTNPKEPHYFAFHGKHPNFVGPGDDAMINQVAVTDFDEYAALYPSTDGLEAWGDGSTSTLYYYRHAIPEIQRVAPDVRIVVALREPVRRAISAYDYLVSRGYETAPGVLAACAEEPGRIAAGYHHLWHYTEMSRYAEALAAFRDTFGPHRVGVVFQEELEASPAQVLTATLRFIGTSPAEGEDAPLGPVNVAGAPRSPMVTATLNTMLRAESLRTVLKANTTWEFRDRVRRSLQIKRDRVDPQIARELAPRFEPERHQLALLCKELTLTAHLPSWLRR